MINIFYTSIFLCTIDKILNFFDIKGRYYLNHFAINSLIVYNCYNDVILSYTSFDNINNLPINIISIEYTYSIHFYHILMYYNTFLYDDWLHHIIMVIFGLPLGTLFKSGPLMGHSLFFLTGLPGGINYLLLFLERNNIIQKNTQKYYNYHLNLWIRQPGCIATSILSMLYYIKYDNTLIEKLLNIYIIIIHYWNGIYFMEQVIRNYNCLYR